MTSHFTTSKTFSCFFQKNIAESYEFAFNAKENDNEVKGAGNSVDFGNRIYDNRIGRWFSVDLLHAKYPELSPYAFCDNNPLVFMDINGDDLVKITVPANKDGSKTKQIVCDKNIADKAYNLAWSMNREHGLVMTNDFRSKKHQKELRDRWDKGNKKGLVCKPAMKSAHSSGMAFDFDIPSNISKSDFEKISETANKSGAYNLGLGDRVHFYFKENENGYKNRDDAINKNDAFFKEASNDVSNIPELKSIKTIKPIPLDLDYSIKPLASDQTNLIINSSQPINNNQPNQSK